MTENNNNALEASESSDQSNFKSPEKASSISVVKAQPEDAEDILSIRTKAIVDAYTNENKGIYAENLRIRLEGRNGVAKPIRQEKWRRDISNEGKDRITYVAKSEDKTRGFITVKNVDGARRISFLFVDPDFQGNGIGSQLLQTALQWGDKDADVHLKVVSYNQDAISFYEKHGFKAVAGSLKPDVHYDDGGISPSKIDMVLSVK